MTAEILRLMKEKRNLTNKDVERYRHVYKIMTKMPKLDGWRNNTKKYKFNNFNLHKKIIEAVGKCGLKTLDYLVNDQGKVWKDYIRELFDDNRLIKPPILNIVNGPSFNWHYVRNFAIRTFIVSNSI